MKHVFVETNWVFEFCAPAHRSTPEAQALPERAGRNELVLHVPAVSLREGGNAIRQKCQPSAKELQEFRRWAAGNGTLDATADSAARAFLDTYANCVRADLAALDRRLDAIQDLPGVDVFALDQRMLDRAIGLRNVVATLKPFDEAILAAVLVKAGDVNMSGAADVFFCDLDGDLVPVDRRGRPRGELVALYATAGITVRQDFAVP